MRDLYLLAALAGWVIRILLAYIRMQESLVFNISYTGGLGAPRTLQRGFPQGCPLSQRMLGLLVRVWYVWLDAAAGIPRALADDRSFMIKGDVEGEITVRGRDSHAGVPLPVERLQAVSRPWV